MLEKVGGILEVDVAASVLFHEKLFSHVITIFPLGFKIEKKFTICTFLQHEIYL